MRVMNLLAIVPELPLLKKELVEQATRKRTYIIRVVYAAALCFFFIHQIFSLMTCPTRHPDETSRSLHA